MARAWLSPSCPLAGFPLRRPASLVRAPAFGTRCRRSLGGWTGLGSSFFSSGERPNIFFWGGRGGEPCFGEPPKIKMGGGGGPRKQWETHVFFGFRRISWLGKGGAPKRYFFRLGSRGGPCFLGPCHVLLGKPLRPQKSGGPPQIRRISCFVASLEPGEPEPNRERPTNIPKLQKSSPFPTQTSPRTGCTAWIHGAACKNRFG